MSPIVEGTLFSIPARRKELAFVHLANDSVSDIIRKTNEYTRNEVERKKIKDMEPSHSFIALFPILQNIYTERRYTRR